MSRHMKKRKRKVRENERRNTLREVRNSNGSGDKRAYVVVKGRIEVY